MGLPYVTSLSLHLHVYCPGGLSLFVRILLRNTPNVNSFPWPRPSFVTSHSPLPVGRKKLCNKPPRIFPPWTNICFSVKYENSSAPRSPRLSAAGKCIFLPEKIHTAAHLILRFAVPQPIQLPRAHSGIFKNGCKIPGLAQPPFDHLEAASQR